MPRRPRCQSRPRCAPSAPKIHRMPHVSGPLAVQAGDTAVAAKGSCGEEGPKRATLPRRLSVRRLSEGGAAATPEGLALQRLTDVDRGGAATRVGDARTSDRGHRGGRRTGSVQANQSARIRRQPRLPACSPRANAKRGLERLRENGSRSSALPSGEARPARLVIFRPRGALHGSSSKPRIQSAFARSLTDIPEESWSEGRAP
jgi:hypothetical protein